MEDKFAKVRAEIERRISRNKRGKVLEDVPEKRRQLIIEGQLLGELKHFIDSIQEEPTPTQPKVRKATGKLKECIDSITEERLKKAYEELEEGSPIKQELDSFMINSGLSLPYDMDVVKVVYHMVNWQKRQFLNKAESFFEEYLAEEDCKFGASEWTELKSKFSSLDDFEKAFKHYINKG